MYNTMFTICSGWWICRGSSFSRRIPSIMGSQFEYSSLNEICELLRFTQMFQNAS